MNILVIGDACEDVFIEGECSRLAPEFPVPVFVPRTERKNWGMAANVIANINSLCPAATIACIIPAKVGRKVRFVDAKTGHYFLRVDEGKSDAVMDADSFTRMINSGPFDAVVISDYAKGFIGADSMGMIGRISESLGVPVFCDTKRLLGEWSKPMIVKINAAEYQNQIDAGLNPSALCRSLIVTQGGEGMTLFDEGKIEHCKAQPIEVKDGAGCGDSVLAALVVRYIENGGFLVGAMEWASKVGAVAVSHRGVVAVRREEVA